MISSHNYLLLDSCLWGGGGRAGMGGVCHHTLLNTSVDEELSNGKGSPFPRWLSWLILTVRVFCGFCS